MESEILIIIIFLLLSAFFSGMEIAFVSANKVKLELDKNQDGNIAKVLRKLTDKPSNFITTMLVGNNVALVIYGFFMGSLISSYLVKYFPNINELGKLFVKTVISTLVILFTAEFLPKVIFQLYSNKLLKLFAFPAYVIYIIFWPISWLTMKISNFILQSVFKTSGDDVQQFLSKTELSKFIGQQIQDAEKTEEEMDSELEILHNALDFADVKAREVMVPRTEIVALEDGTDIEELKSTFIETGLSKIIIYDENIDNITGYVHSFDLFKNPKNIKRIIREVEFAPETVSIHDLMKEMTKKKKSISVILDEYGGTSGIITLEDIIEEIFGEIEDEHDKNELFEKQIAPNTYIFSGRFEIYDLNKNYNLNIPEDDNYETLGGYILSKVGEIPEEGEEFDMDHFHIKINKTNQKQIQKVILHVLTREE